MPKKFIEILAKITTNTISIWEICIKIDQKFLPHQWFTFLTQNPNPGALLKFTPSAINLKDPCCHFMTHHFAVCHPEMPYICTILNTKTSLKNIYWLQFFQLPRNLSKSMQNITIDTHQGNL